MRRGEAFFEKNIVSGLVAKKNSSRRTQARTNFALNWAGCANSQSITAPLCVIVALIFEMFFTFDRTRTVKSRGYDRDSLGWFILQPSHSRGTLQRWHSRCAQAQHRFRASQPREETVKLAILSAEGLQSTAPDCTVHYSTPWSITLWNRHGSMNRRSRQRSSFCRRLARSTQIALVPFEIQPCSLIARLRVSRVVSGVDGGAS
jgi:hypothetical protein